MGIMRSSIKRIILFLSILASSGAILEAATLTVYVKDQNGNPLPGAKVMLITHSQINSTGWWALIRINPGLVRRIQAVLSTGTITYEYINNSYYRNYQLLVTKQNYSPTSQQQMNDWRYGQQWV